MPRLRPTLVDLGDGPIPRTLRDPRDQRLLPPVEGREVPLSPFWARRLRDGDVEIVPEAAPPEEAAPAATDTAEA